MFDEGSTITPSSDAEWKAYYQRKHIEVDNQLKDLAWAFSHVLRFAFEEKPFDAYLLGQRVCRKLTYPRDKNQILEVLKNFPQFGGSILRGEE